MAPREGKGRVVGIDLLPIEPLPGAEFIALDFMDAAAPDRLTEMLGGEADIVLSDMAANATGHRKTDHLRIVGLAEAAAEFARDVLAPGGAFVAKVLQGGTEGALLADLKRDFATVRHVKPAASRAEFGRALRAGDGVSKDALSRLRESQCTYFLKNPSVLSQARSAAALS